MVELCRFTFIGTRYERKGQSMFNAASEKPGVTGGPKLLAASAMMILAAGSLSGAASAMTITPHFESSITGSASYSTIASDINSALTFYNQNILNNVNVSIDFAVTSTTSSASYLGQSKNTIYTPSYTTYTSAMQTNATQNANAIELSAYNNLQYGNDSNGATSIDATAPNMRALTPFTAAGTIPTEIMLGTPERLMGSSR